MDILNILNNNVAGIIHQDIDLLPSWNTIRKLVKTEAGTEDGLEVGYFDQHGIVYNLFHEKVIVRFVRMITPDIICLHARDLPQIFKDPKCPNDINIVSPSTYNCFTYATLETIIDIIEK